MVEEERIHITRTIRRTLFRRERGGCRQSRGKRETLLLRFTCARNWREYFLLTGEVKKIWSYFKYEYAHAIEDRYESAMYDYVLCKG